MVAKRSAGSTRIIRGATQPPDEEALRNGSIVGHLQETLGDEETFSLFPGWLVDVVEGKLWRRFCHPATFQLFEWDDFDAFVRARRPLGLGIKEGVGKLYAECRFYADQGNHNAVKGVALLREMMPELGAEAGGAPKGNRNAAKSEEENNRSVTTVVRKVEDRGETYLLRRLKRDRPDLAERVIADELSAHAAAVEAGFRARMVQHPVTVDGFVRAIEKHLDDRQRNALIKRLGG